MRRVIILLLLSVYAAGCAALRDERLKVGVTPGPQAEIVADVRKRAARDGFMFDIVTYDTFEAAANYIRINTDLKSGRIDVNCFQNRWYLAEAEKMTGLAPVVLGSCYITPLGLYSAKYRLDNIPERASVALPADPAGLGRSLLLLARAGLLALLSPARDCPVLADIADNPLQLRLTPLDPFSLSGELAAYDLSILGPDHAREAGLRPDEALWREDGASPFVQLIVARDGADRRAADFTRYYQSAQTRVFIEEKFQGWLLPAW
jgi:D-methionine transport system substrate-binding protein